MPALKRRSAAPPARRSQVTRAWWPRDQRTAGPHPGRWGQRAVLRSTRRGPARAGRPVRAPTAASGAPSSQVVAFDRTQARIDAEFRGDAGDLGPQSLDVHGGRKVDFGNQYVEVTGESCAEVGDVAAGRGYHTGQPRHDAKPAQIRVMAK